MNIYGTSGVSIFLAAQVMRRHKPKVYLKDSEIKNNHSAVLRFKDDKISKFLNVPFKKVSISKIIRYEGHTYTNGNLQFSNMYSQKVTGKILDRSINNLENEIRYIAPDNFLEILTYGLDIVYNCDIDEEVLKDCGVPKLSYCKMPDLMDKLGYNKPEFSYSPVYTLNVKLKNPECNVYQTIYYPGLEKYYRASITKDNLIIEYVDKPHEREYSLDIAEILSQFGIKEYELDLPKFNELPVGKLSPIPEATRRDFIYKLTNEHDIYSFGRNGIWKSIRLDELFEDILKIDKMIENGLYYRNKSLASEL